MALRHVTRRGVHAPFRGAACVCAAILFAWSGAPLSASPDALDTSVTIGEGWAIVREVRRMDLVAGEQELVLRGIPAQADLGSLTIRTRRIPVDLLEWERLDPGARRASQVADADELVIDASGAVHTGADESDARREAGAVRCRIRIPVGGARSLEVVYRVTGLEWSSYYQVFMHGDPDGLDEGVTLDLAGFLRIENETGLSFPDARVRLVGADPRLPREPDRRPGFLLLADTPLAGLWEPGDVDPPPEFVYRMPRRVSIPARTDTDARLIEAHRISATRLFVMDAREIPLSATGNFQPLNEYLVFKNTAANGLGWMLPAGPVEVFHGVTRRTLQLPGFLPHTPINREIRVDLGKADDVQGMRRSVRRTRPESGYYEELFRLGVENLRTRDIAVEIRERPPGALTWDVQSATQEYELEGGWLLMRPRLREGEMREIDLRLRFHKPTL